MEWLLVASFIVWKWFCIAWVLDFDLPLVQLKTTTMASYRPKSNVVSTEIDDEESVLLSLETQQYYSLNETGSRIWALLSDGHDTDDIASAVTEEWAITHEEAMEYVRSFLQELSQAGLVEERSDDPAT